MEDVAAGAGVAKGTPYLYFRSKADLVTAVRDQYGRELVDHAGGLLGPEAAAEPATRRLELFATSMFEFIIARQELHHVLFHEAGTSEEEQLRPVIEMVERFLRSAIAAGELRPGDPRFLATVVVSGVHAAMLPSLHEGNPDRAGFAALTRDLIARLFG